MTDTRKAGPHHETGPHENASDTENTRVDSDMLAAAAGYAVLVETGEGRYRRRLFLTLASAERAVERAEDRGQSAHLVLCQIVPTGVIA